MTYIFPEIMSLMQYVNIIKSEPEKFRLKKCPNCGKNNLWLHGGYTRESDRINPSNQSLNSIFIQRYYCHACGKTCSVLPECIPPRRWYLWETQQTVILLFLLGYSAKSAAKKVKLSRHTVKRWVSWLINKFKLHKDALCNYFPNFGLCTDPINFWNCAFNKLSLSKAMRLCHISGVSIP